VTSQSPSTAVDAVRFDAVEKRFGTTTALAGSSFAIARGEMFGLIGPDGAGKTTAIRLLCGLLRPDAGTVTVLGVDPAGQHRAITERVGYLSQRFTLYGDLTIDENIEFFAEIRGVRNFRPRREQLLEMTRLTPFRRRLADRLSGGMKQKLALACTLVHEPELVVLDEPTTGVDPVSRREFWKLLSAFLARGVTIVMSTPYLDEAERCTRVVLMHEGRVLAADEPSRLRARLPGGLLEVVAPGVAAAVDAVRRVPGVVDAHAFGDRLHVRLASADAVAVDAFTGHLRRGLAPEASVRAVEASLEDVFIATLEQQEHAHA